LCSSDSVGSTKTKLLLRLLRFASATEDIVSRPMDFRTGGSSPPKETVRVRFKMIGDSLTDLISELSRDGGVVVIVEVVVVGRVVMMTAKMANFPNPAFRCADEWDPFQRKMRMK
jgi:hypothetical protein